MSLATWIDERPPHSEKRLQTVQHLTRGMGTVLIIPLLCLALYAIGLTLSGRTSFWLTSALDLVISKALAYLG